MSNCVDKLINIVQEVKAPLTIEVVKSIAHLCHEDPYSLWHKLASMYTTTLIEQRYLAKPQHIQIKREAEKCWKCPACNKTFDDFKHLVNHITYFVRQHDTSHTELYKKLKKISSDSGKTFSEIVASELKCS